MRRQWGVTGFGWVVAIWACLGALVQAEPLQPVEIRGTTFAREVRAGDQALVLRGAGLLRYKRVIPVYTAALYVTPADRGQDVLGNVVKRLEVEYLVKAEARDFNEGGEDTLRDALTPEALAGLRERLDQINALYPDPKPGDRCTLTYIPDIGTELIFNGQKLGVIPGEDFQRAYFGIWLGDNPANAALRDALLGKEKG